MRTEKEFYVTISDEFKHQILNWATSHYEQVAWLDSNQYPDSNRKVEAVLATAAFSTFEQYTTENAFENLKSYIRETGDWIFGFLSYDLKNDIENLQSKNFDGLQFPEIYFFQPIKIIFFEKNKLIFSYLSASSSDIDSDFEKIMSFSPPKTSSMERKGKIKSKISKASYLKRVSEMQKYIARGDIYEANFCQEFYMENMYIYPTEIYRKLNQISESPFASFLKMGTRYLLSASPERYLQRTGNRVISQPIKGTAKRSNNLSTDQILRVNLEQNSKERAENVMIVDLVRNDLSIFAQRGSVRVTELCKPYTFKQVHQLISTVQAEIASETDSVDVIRSTFPMGSMTGAPKISAMQIIEKLEASKRGIYSGAVGYFTPRNDFDFNVVIRSICYNSENEYVSFSVGSAITAGSNPEKEYDECLIKAAAMYKVLSEE